MNEDAIYEISENLHQFLICYGHLICDFLYFGALCRDVRDVIYNNIWLSRLRENKHGSWGYVYTKFGDNRAAYRFRRVRWRPSLNANLFMCSAIQCAGITCFFPLYSLEGQDKHNHLNSVY